MLSASRFISQHLFVVPPSGGSFLLAIQSRVNAELQTMAHPYSALLRCAQPGVQAVDQFLRLAALDTRDVVLILEQHTERVGNDGRIERHRVELSQGRRPVERFGDARSLE